MVQNKTHTHNSILLLALCLRVQLFSKGAKTVKIALKEYYTYECAMYYKSMDYDGPREITLITDPWRPVYIHTEFSMYC